MPAYRDKTGRWRYRKWVRLPSGKRVRIKGTPTTNTKAAAEDAERKHILRAQNPTITQEDKTPIDIPTVRDYVSTFLAAYKPDQKASERRAKSRIIKLLEPDFGSLPLDQVNQEHVGRWVSRQTTGAKTINNRLAVLSSLLRFAADNGLIPRPRLRMTVSSMAAELVAVPMEDVDQLLHHAPPILHTGILLAAEAGLRAGELRGLQWTDIKDRTITIRRALDTDTNEVQPPKHHKTRMVPVSERLERSLKTLVKRGLWVLSQPDGRPLSHRRGLYLPLLEVYDKAEVPVPPSPVHCLRHTFGTSLAARGVPLPVIQELMGHSKIETTRRYIHVNREQKVDAIRIAFGPKVGPDSENPPQVP